MSWMIYGANGYTGRLVVEEAVRRGERPVLAGRDAAAVSAMASAWGLERRVFGLDRPADVAAGVRGMSAVLSCAGPFSATAGPLVDAAVATGAHYLDITGELAVFEALFRRSDTFARVGVVVLPGVGFDVVPTDGVAALLAEAVPGAARLELGFVGGGGVSPGTARTAVEGLAAGGWERRGGRLVRVSVGHRTRRVLLGGRERVLTSIPWGDLATAWRTTGIGDITTYTVLPRRAAPWLASSGWWGRALGTTAVKAALARVIGARVRGPDAVARAAGVAWVWGRAEADDGRWAEARLRCPEGYTLTATAAVEATLRVVAGQVGPGVWTPAQAFGARFVTGLPGVHLEAIETSGR
jgi:short subunit dehydrogenase-like uncharacterized protein